MKTLTYLILLLGTPFLAISNGTSPADSVVTAIRIEYDLQFFERDSLISYSEVPYKKILAIKEGEALYENLAEATFANRLRYFDLDAKMVYSNFKHYETIGKLVKLEWVRKGHVIASNGAAPYDILGMPCETYRVKLKGDTLSVHTTQAFGLDFYEHADLKGVPLEFEEFVEGIGKIKYRAVKIDTVEVHNKRMGYILQNHEIADYSGHTKKFEKSKRKWKEQKKHMHEKILGTKAKPYEGITMDGQNINSIQLQGKIQVLNFWFTKCSPCIAEMPSLNKVVEHFGNDDEIVFLSFCLDDKIKTQAVLDKTPFHYQICPDAQKIIKKHKVSAFPLNLIIDKNGNITSYIMGKKLDIAKILIEDINALKNNG